MSMNEPPEDRKLILGLAKEVHRFARFAFAYPLFLWTICIIAVIFAGSYSYATWINPHKPEYVVLPPSAADLLREQALARSPFRHCFHLSEEEQYHCAKTVLAMRDEELRPPNVATKEQKGAQPHQCFQALTTNCGVPPGSPGGGESGGSPLGTGFGLR
jgi:hypothetical protein